MVWNCVLTSKATRNADPAVDAIDNPANASFKITDRKLYIPVVSLSTENDKILWFQNRSEMSNQTKNKKLHYLIDLTFTKVNRLFVFSFENKNDRTSFSKYCTQDLNFLIDGKSFFGMPIKNNEETYKQIIEIGRKNDYTTGNLLEYEYCS